VSDKGASSLMEFVAALSDFDHQMMGSLTTPGRQLHVGLSQMLRTSRAAALCNRSSNASRATGQPPKAPRSRRYTAKCGGLHLGRGVRGAGRYGGSGCTSCYGDRGVPARAPMVLSASLLAEFQSFLNSRVGAGVTESGASGGGTAGGASTGSS